MKRLDVKAKRRKKGRERERQREKERGKGRGKYSKRVGDEGAFPVRSVEKGDRGGYRVAWVCDGTGSCRETREGTEEGVGEENSRGMERERRDPGEFDRENTRGGKQRRKKENLKSARKMIRLRRNSMNEEQDGEIEGQCRVRENEME